MAEKKFGPDHPRVGTSLNNLAVLYRNQGRYAEAEPLFKRSLTIIEKALEKDHQFVGKALLSVARMYQAQADWKRATEYYRRGITVITQRTRLGTQIIGQGLTGKRKSEAARWSIAFKTICEVRLSPLATE